MYKLNYGLDSKCVFGGKYIFLNVKLGDLFIYNNFIVKSMLVIIGNYQCECGVFSLVRDILQWNVAGLPLIHQVGQKL